MLGRKCRFSQSFRIPGVTLENGAVLNEGNYHFCHHSWFCLSACVSILPFSLLMPTILYSPLNFNQLHKGWLLLNTSSDLIPNLTAQVRKARTQTQLPLCICKIKMHAFDQPQRENIWKHCVHTMYVQAIVFFCPLYKTG